MAFSDLELRHFYFLLLEELFQRTNLLQDQARHVSIVSGFLAGRGLGGESSGVNAILACATSIEERLTQASAALKHDVRTATSAVDHAQLRGVLNARTLHFERISEILGQLRTTQRALAGLIDAIPTDYSRPAAFHALKQFEILQATSDLAYRYCGLACQTVNNALLPGAAVRLQPSDVVISYEPMDFPRQRCAVEGTHLQVFARLPFWCAYMPRYLPLIAHELAHPILEYLWRATTAQAETYRDILQTYETTIRELLTTLLGNDIHFALDGFERTMVLESIADMLALHVAGPSYIPALSISAIGATRMSSAQSLALPMSVRLAMLLAAFQHMARDQMPSWATILELVRKDLDLYSDLCRRESSSDPGYGAKLRYQELLTDVLIDLFKKVSSLLRLNSFSGPLAEDPPTNSEWRVGDFISSLPALPQYSSLVTLRGCPEVTMYEQGTLSLEHAPNLLWLLYFANASSRTEPSAPFVPEGRIYHEYHRQTRIGQQEDTARHVDIEFGDYWEVLFFEVLWTRKGNIQSATLFNDMRDCLTAKLSSLCGVDSTAALFTSFGLFDFVTFRDRFEAKRYRSWPPSPKEAPFPYYAHKHIVQEVLLVADTDQILFRTGLRQLLKRDDLLVITQLQLKEKTLLEPILLKLLRTAPKGLVRGIFRSLAWEDLVLLWHIDKPGRMGAVERLLNELPNIERAISQTLLLPSQFGTSDLASDTAESPDAPAPCALQIHIRTSRPGATAEIREMMNDTVLRYVGSSLGRYDPVFHAPADSVKDLQLALGCLEKMAKAGLIVETETHVLLQD